MSGRGDVFTGETRYCLFTVAGRQRVYRRRGGTNGGVRLTCCVLCAFIAYLTTQRYNKTSYPHGRYKQEYLTWNNILPGTTSYLKQHLTWNILPGTTSYLEQHLTWNNILPGTTSYLEQHLTWNNILPGTTSYLEHLTWNILPGTTSYLEHLTWNNILPGTTSYLEHLTWNNILPGTSYLEQHLTWNNILPGTNKACPTS